MGELRDRLLDALGSAAQVRALLAEGADPNALDDEEMPVIFAVVEAGDPDVLAALLDGGADIEAIAPSIAWTPLYCAVAVGAVDAFALLLERGARFDVNDADGKPMLFRAVEEAAEPGASLAIVRALLARGADPNARRPDGSTPLMVACSASLELVELLLAAGADPGATVVEHVGGTPVDAAVVAARAGRSEVVDLFVKSRAREPLASTTAALERHWQAIAAWCGETHPELRARIEVAAAASDEALRELEATIGRALPHDLRAELRLHGVAPARGGTFYAEYDGLDVHRIASTWSGLKGHLDAGTFQQAPKELPAHEHRLRRAWWSPGWIPFAEDSCGNLLCVDTDALDGVTGRVLQWEIHAGPVGPVAESLEAYLHGIVRDVAAGRYVLSGGMVERDGWR